MDRDGYSPVSSTGSNGDAADWVCPCPVLIGHALWSSQKALQDTSEQHRYQRPTPYQSAKLTARHTLRHPTIENIKNGAVDISKDLRLVAGDKLMVASAEAKSAMNKAFSWASGGTSHARKSLGSWMSAASRPGNDSVEAMRQREIYPAFKPEPNIFSSGLDHRAGERRSRATRQHQEYPATPQKQYIAAERGMYDYRSTRGRGQASLTAPKRTNQ